MVWFLNLTLALWLSQISLAAAAGEIMFEGYYRIDLEKKSIGYAIQRYE